MTKFNQIANLKYQEILERRPENQLPPFRWNILALMLAKHSRGKHFAQDQELLTSATKSIASDEKKATKAATA
jgi:hypothetical protein